jgi:hypothetical protein
LEHTPINEGGNEFRLARQLANVFGCSECLSNSGHVPEDHFEDILEMIESILVPCGNFPMSGFSATIAS